MLQDENLSQEEMESVELHVARVSGLLLNTWLPVGIIRKTLMLSFILIGFAGVFSQNQWLQFPLFIFNCWYVFTKVGGGDCF